MTTEEETEENITSAADTGVSSSKNNAGSAKTTYASVSGGDTDVSKRLIIPDVPKAWLINEIYLRLDICSSGALTDQQTHGV